MWCAVACGGRDGDGAAGGRTVVVGKAMVVGTMVVVVVPRGWWLW